MKKIILTIATAALCLSATAHLAAAEETSGENTTSESPAAAHSEHRELDQDLMKVIDQTLLERQKMEIGKKYPSMLFKPEMMAKMMGERALQQSMQNAVQPAKLVAGCHVGKRGQCRS